jgi:hypothetical protein
MKIKKILFVANEKLPSESVAAITTYEDVHTFLSSFDHGEYIYIYYYGDNGAYCNYSFRCWYNDNDACIKKIDGLRCYDWDKSQKYNSQRLWRIISNDLAAEDAYTIEGLEWQRITDANGNILLPH